MRRSQGAALLGVGALLLVLVAHLPAPSVPRHPRAPPAASLAQPAVPPLAHNDTNHTAPAPSSTRSPPQTTVAPPPPPPAPPQPPAHPAPAAAPHPVLTKELYVSGHESPHPELCPALGAHTRMLILITSAPSHAEARDAIRLTWGHYAARRDVTLGFMLGQPPAALRPALAAEDALYGDLIMGRFQDSYSNLTLKTLSMLEWADTYCPRAPRLLKTDDDMFINVPRLLRFAEADNRRNASRTIWGKVVKKSYPKRTTKSKYYVSPAQFPGKVFPDFATGPAYLLTADCVRPLLQAAGAERYLRLEDVFVTGVLAARLGIARHLSHEFYNKKVQPHPCTVQRGLAIHMVRYHEQFDLWRKLLDGKTKCAV